MANRGSYVHNSMVEFWRASQKCFMQFSQKLMVSDKMIHRAFRTRTTLYKTKPIREIFHFYHLPKLYIGFEGLMEVREEWNQVK